MNACTCPNCGENVCEWDGLKPAPKDETPEANRSKATVTSPDPIARAEKAEAEARTERERREEAEDWLTRAWFALTGSEDYVGDLVARAQSVVARAETAEARLSTAQTRVEELERRAKALAEALERLDTLVAASTSCPTGTEDWVGFIEYLGEIARQALSNPTPSERKGHHPAPSPLQDREAG